MMLGLGTAPISLQISIPRKDPCPAGATLVEQRDEYIGGDFPQPANICLFSSLQDRDTYFASKRATSFYLPLAGAAVVGLLIAWKVLS